MRSKEYITFLVLLQFVLFGRVLSQTTDFYQDLNPSFEKPAKHIALSRSAKYFLITYELTKALFTDLRKGTGATVISSAGGGEYAMESGEWKNGLFTYTLLKGIETGEADLNNDGEIWLKELQEYVQTQVTELSGGKQQPTSRIENSVPDYLFEELTNGRQKPTSRIENVEFIYRT